MEMRQLNLVLALLLIFPAASQAAAPTRAFNYVAHTTIDPTQNNTNENAIYSYLQAGVDTYASGTITNDAISAIAAISYSKLNLIGSITNSDINASAGIVGSKLDLSSPGIIGASTPAAATFTNLTASGTIKLGVTNRGDVFYDNGTSVVRLTPGTTGYFLQTQGAGANPQWASGGIRAQVFISSGTFTAPAGITTVYLTGCGGGGGGGGGQGGVKAGGGGGSGQCLVNSLYTVIPGNGYTVTINSGGAAGTGGGGGTAGGTGGSVVFDALTLSGGNGGQPGAGTAAGGAALAATLTGANGSGGTGGAAGVGAYASGAGGNGEAGAGTVGGGAGGSCPLSRGGAGGSGASAAATGGYGAGGGGAGSTGASNGTAAAGGAGIIVVMY